MPLINKQISLSDYTYMKVGGPADYLAVATTVSDLVSLSIEARNSHLPFMIIGGGSNTIFSDAGYRGLVIINRTANCNINRETGIVVADAGLSTNALVNQTIDVGLAGLETFLGVPGSVGGAIYNNSHYLTELIGNYVHRVLVLNQDNQQVWLTQAEMHFAYDYSILHDTHDIVLQVEYILKPDNTNELKRKASVALNRRRESQPLSLPSSGCMFQNVKTPQPTSAGALIDRAGLKGMRIGGAEVSPVHANFIVNTGGASAKDIIDLSELVKNTVKKKFGLTLEREVFILDEHGERLPI